MKRIILVSAMITLLFTSCNKRQQFPVIDNAELSGTWQEQPVAGTFAGVLHSITFLPSGSFQMKLVYFSDAIEPNNPCGGNRTEYAKGQYTLLNESPQDIHFSGTYADSSFTVAQPARCTLLINYEETYYLLDKKASEITLSSVQSSGTYSDMHFRKQ